MSVNDASWIVNDN